MSGGDEGLEIFGRPVGRLGGKEEHSVVTPTSLTGEIGDRHQLDDGDSQFREVVQSVRRAGKGALPAEGPHVQLIHHCLVPGRGAPSAVSPGEGPRIDNLAGSCDILRVESRRRVRNLELAVDPISVPRPDTCLWSHELVPAVTHGGQRNRRAFDECELHSLGRGSPESETNPAVALELRAEGHTVYATHR